MSLPHMLGGLAEIADQYDALIVDIWGVLHNGKQPFEGVDAALLNYRQQGGKVLLLSNAPRPARLPSNGWKPSAIAATGLMIF